MRVFYDDQIFSLQKYGGISRYHFELIKTFSIKNDPSVILSTLLSDNQYLNTLGNGWNAKLLPNIKNEYLERLIYLINRIYSSRLLKAKSFEVFHPTFYDPYFLSLLKGKPYVITIHDMIHEKYPEYFNSNDTTSKRKRLIAKNANKIIAVSENTKEDIIRFFNIPEEKIKVIYHGNSLTNSINPNSSITHADKFILYVGNRSRYKNFKFLISAFPDIIKNIGELKIICAGGGRFNKEEQQLFKQLNIDKQISQQPVDDLKLSNLYKQASLFIFPSLYEGFGIPILEAFEFNCPILCSDIAALREIAKDGALYFESGNRDSLIYSVINILQNDSAKKELIELGKKRRLEFSWSKCAAETYKVYKTV